MKRGAPLASLPDTVAGENQFVGHNHVTTLSADAERILASFEQQWQAGKTPAIESLLPAVDQPDYLPLLEELIRVDLEFRRNRRELPALESVLDRFPRLREHPAVCQRLASEFKRLQTPTVVPSDRTTLPQPSSDFRGFQLLSSLGQGAFARVYLARQNDLAQRLVVLKVAQAVEWEAQSLARLQHTNIVPIFSVHESDGQFAICMPFLGVTTLADLVDVQLDRQAGHSSAQDWISTVAARKLETIVARDKEWETATPNAQPHRPISEILSHHLGFQFQAIPRQSNWQYALAWIWQQAADGLAHAHAHGITHGDIKPANILLSDDGHPLLLDFNLATNRNQLGAPIAGGTLPYMSAEQLHAFHQGNPSDEGGDLYSLAVVMYQLFTGRLPFPARQGDWEEVIGPMLQDRQRSIPAPRQWVADLHPDLESILQKSLHVTAGERYRSVSELQEDLSRFLAYLPLRHAPNRSWAVRLQNWSRRHPRISSASTVAAAALILLAGTGWSIYQAWQRLDRVEQAQRVHDWSSTLRRTQWPLTVIDPPRLTQVQHIENLRSLLAEAPPPDALFIDSQNSQPISVSQLVLNAQLVLAGTLLQQATISVDRAERSRLLEEIHKIHQSCQANQASAQNSVGLTYQRSRWERLQGNTAQSEALLQAAGNELPQTDIDCIRAAYEQLAWGASERAQTLLRLAIAKNSLNFEAWLLLGNAHAMAANLTDAESCFSVCLGLETDSEIVYFNRARARYDRGDMAGAIADYSRAIELNDQEPAYYSNRALVYIAQEKWNEALRDLSAAIDRQAPESRVYYLRSQVLEALGKTDEAAADLQIFLEQPAIDAESLVTRSVVHWQHGQQEKALEDVAAAANLDPTSVEAWQNQAAFLSALPERGAAAIEAMDQVVDLQPQNPVARASRGVLHARLGNVEQAQQDAQHALQLDTTADTQYRVAGIYALLAKQPGLEESMNDRAWQLLRAALSAQPQLVAAYVQNDPDIEPLKTDARWQELKQVLQALELWPAETKDGNDRS